MRLLIGLILMLAAVSLHAQPYVLLGPAKAKVEAGSSASGSAPYTAAGYRFTEHLAIEASYLTTGTVRGTKVSGAGLAAIGALPLAGGFSIISKLGGYALKAESTNSTLGAALGSGPPPASVDLGMRPAVGIGLQYAVHPRLQVRSLVELVDGKGELERLRIVSVGLVVAFP